MKMKRIMALVMTSAMVMGTLAGCGASTDTTDTTQSQSENNSTAAAATTETASEEKEWYGTEDGKTVTLQFWGGIQPEYGYDEIVENFNKEYADKGVQVEYNRYVNNSDGNLQLETYLMAGEDGGADVFIGYGSKNSLAIRADGGLSPLSAIVLYIAGILVVGIPLVSLVFAIFRPVFNWQPMVSGLKWTLLILWIVSATIFFICYTMQGFTFPELLMRG